MNYTNEMKIKFERKEDVAKAMPVIIDAFKSLNIYDDYSDELQKRVVDDLSVEDELIVLGDGLEGYFDPEDSRIVFENVFAKLAETLTLIDFLAEAGNLGTYSSSKVTAQFINGSFSLQNEYWSGLSEDGDSELKETSKYFF